MSDLICPDCHSFEVNRFKEFDKCDFCGWEGSHLNYEEPTEESYDMLEREFLKKKKLREASQLFFVRIYANSLTDYDEILHQLTKMELISFKVNFEKPSSFSPYILIFATKRPNEEYITKVRSIDAVSMVTVT